MVKSGIATVDYAINPYLGCEHGCVYCYARFMKRMGHKNEDWGTFVDVKINALDRLKLEMPRKKRGLVLLSSVTDPYQPLENNYRLTRKILDILLEYQFPISILTKSNLVLRDVDLLKKFDWCEVGFTLTSADDGVRQKFEPKASRVKNRLDAMKKLCDIGIETYAFLGPMLPYLSEKSLQSLMDTLAGITNRILVDRLNIKSGNLSTIRHTLTTYYPKLQDKFEFAISKKSDYYNKLKQKITEMCIHRGIPCEIIF